MARHFIFRHYEESDKYILQYRYYHSVGNICSNRIDAKTLGIELPSKNNSKKSTEEIPDDLNTYKYTNIQDDKPTRSVKPITRCILNVRPTLRVNKRHPNTRNNFRNSRKATVQQKNKKATNCRTSPDRKVPRKDNRNRYLISDGCYVCYAPPAYTNTVRLVSRVNTGLKRATLTNGLSCTARTSNSVSRGNIKNKTPRQSCSVPDVVTEYCYPNMCQVFASPHVSPWSTNNSNNNDFESLDDCVKWSVGCKNQIRRGKMVIAERFEPKIIKIVKRSEHGTLNYSRSKNPFPNDIVLTDSSGKETCEEIFPEIICKRTKGKRVPGNKDKM